MANYVDEINENRLLINMKMKSKKKLQEEHFSEHFPVFLSRILDEDSRLIK